DGEASVAVGDAGYHDLEAVVMAVAMLVGAGAEGRLVLLVRPLGPVVAVGGAEADDAGQEGGGHGARVRENGNRGNDSCAPGARSDHSPGCRRVTLPPEFYPAATRVRNSAAILIA